MYCIARILQPVGKNIARYNGNFSVNQTHIKFYCHVNKLFIAIIFNDLLPCIS